MDGLDSSRPRSSDWGRFLFGVGSPINLVVLLEQVAQGLAHHRAAF